MLSTGIPELKEKKDIFHLRNTLKPELSDTDAADFFRQLIKASVKTTRTQLNDMAHNLAHNKHVGNRAA